MDFTGALLVKSHQDELIKVYVCLFTCLTYRCVNLEVVSDLSAERFILAFRRHCAVFSAPKLCMSDNASNFRSASEDIKELLEIVNGKQAQELYRDKGINFKNIPVKAPWWGGAWESLIGVMKNSIKKVLGRSLVHLDELQTLVKEIQAVMNDRPLTYLSDDVDDPSPLTPAHILMGFSINSLPYAQYEEDGDYNENLKSPEVRKRYNYRVQLFHSVQKRFKDEYLNTLREIHSYRKQGQEAKTDSIAVGDIVIVYEKCKPRIRWKLARVKELHKGRDNLTRAATIFSDTGTCVRSIVDLYPLEVRADCISTQEGPNLEDIRRSTRKCAQRTSQKIKEHYSNLDSE